MTNDSPANRCPHCGKEISPDGPSCGCARAETQPAWSKPAPLADGPPGGEPLGNSYLMYELLGRGAMGEVRRGRTRAGEFVAIKVLRPEVAGDPALVARFIQEHSVLARLNHPNIVRVRDLVTEDDKLAIVMDLVDGVDLRTELGRRRTLPPAEAATLMAGLLDGLTAVHAAGVVHRDLKPENVLLDSRPAAAPDATATVPRITDFGVSKILGTGTAWHQTSVIGTPAYMAPELFDGALPSPASDLYAVGIMLYELLCGVPPFAGYNPLEVVRQHATALPGRPAGIPDPLWSLITRLLAKRPDERPVDAIATANRLRRFAATNPRLPAAAPLMAPPPPSPAVPDTTSIDAMPPPRVGTTRTSGSTRMTTSTHTSAIDPPLKHPGKAGRSRLGMGALAATFGVVLIAVLAATVVNTLDHESQVSSGPSIDVLATTAVGSADAGDNTATGSAAAEPSPATSADDKPAEEPEKDPPNPPKKKPADLPAPPRSPYSADSWYSHPILGNGWHCGKTVNGKVLSTQVCLILAPRSIQPVAIVRNRLHTATRLAEVTFSKLEFTTPDQSTSYVGGFECTATEVDIDDYLGCFGQQTTSYVTANYLFSVSANVVDNENREILQPTFSYP